MTGESRFRFGFSGKLFFNTQLSFLLVFQPSLLERSHFLGGAAAPQSTLQRLIYSQSPSRLLPSYLSPYTLLISASPRGDGTPSARDRHMHTNAARIVQPSTSSDGFLTRHIRLRGGGWARSPTPPPPSRFPPSALC